MKFNEDEIISNFKHYILNDMFNHLEDYFYEIISEEYNNRINYQYIFQKLYLYSCIKGKKEILEVLFNIYKTFSIVDKIALRPTIIYGKYIYKGVDYPFKLSPNNEY